jgi:hypothetical protein
VEKWEWSENVGRWTLGDLEVAFARTREKGTVEKEGP